MFHENVLSHAIWTFTMLPHNFVFTLSDSCIISMQRSPECSRSTVAQKKRSLLGFTYYYCPMLHEISQILFHTRQARENSIRVFSGAVYHLEFSLTMMQCWSLTIHWAEDSVLSVAQLAFRTNKHVTNEFHRFCCRIRLSSGFYVFQCQSVWSVSCFTTTFICSTAS